MNPKEAHAESLWSRWDKAPATPCTKDTNRTHMGNGYGGVASWTPTPPQKTKLFAQHPRNVESSNLIETFVVGMKRGNQDDARPTEDPPVRKDC